MQMKKKLLLIFNKYLQDENVILYIVAIKNN